MDVGSFCTSVGSVTVAITTSTVSDFGSLARLTASLWDEELGATFTHPARNVTSITNITDCL